MFGSHLDTVEQRRTALTVHSSDPETDLAERLATRNVSVTHRPLPPGGPDPYVTIRKDRGPVSAVSVGQLEQFLTPSGDRPAAVPGSGPSDAVELLDQTLFRSLDRRQLLLASREIEDRAFRVGSGTLRAHFQTQTSFAPQERFYRRLAAETDLSVHIYGTSEWTVPDIDGIEFHAGEGHCLEQYWSLAFDGGPEPSQACVLLAREADTGYDGFWSYDPGLVADVIETFETLD